MFVAHHQLKDMEEGFKSRTMFYFGKEMVVEHKLHLAMEKFEMIQAAVDA